MDIVHIHGQDMHNQPYKLDALTYIENVHSKNTCGIEVSETVSHEKWQRHINKYIKRRTNKEIK